MIDTEKVRVLDMETGELLLEYTPGSTEDIPAIVNALRRLKERMVELTITKRVLESALLEACPIGYKAPGLSIGVDINLAQDDAKALTEAGYGHLVSLSEIVKYRLLKTELKKLEKLQPERYEEVMSMLRNCTRSIHIE